MKNLGVAEVPIARLGEPTHCDQVTGVWRTFITCPCDGDHSWRGSRQRSLSGSKYLQKEKTPMKKVLLLVGAVLAVAQLSMATTVLTFEGLQCEEPVASFYNGGLGGNGSGPGPNFGITFPSNALALQDAA